MKNFLTIIFVLSVLSNNIYSQVNPDMEKVKSIVKNVKEKFAPDKRVAVFNIEVEQPEKKIVIKGETNLPEAKQELIRTLDGEAIKYEDKIEVLPSKELGDKIYGVINLSVSNVRTNPDHPAELSTQSLLGTPIKVLKKGQLGFFLVQTPDGYISWLDDDGFQMMNETEWNEWKQSQKIIYTNEFGWAYEKPDKSSQHISDLVAGNLLKILNEEKDFYFVEFPDNRTAYVLKSESEKFDQWYSSLNPSGESILSTAYRFMGVPYLWGGTSSKGMDCSGFTKTVYFLNGIILPRDASQQVHTGELVDTKNGWENLQAGDLLFFGSKADGERKERITHVAIYIGDGDFIHAAGRVRINSFNKAKPYYSEYRDNAFIRAKRILTSVGKNGIEKIMDNEFYK
ncbi:MAG: C40 family peptidase [Ignavibacterium album]|uniref:C40 family peptidase n=1 Tax=Ignavibacterium album TaxID=591197 RepID=UPI0026E9C2D2|nr:C40 family peptidase [Ignavibacterium album]MBI5661649.1 C40 family peptidase [Ignavibacterium album]